MIGWGSALHAARRITYVQGIVQERRERRQSMRWKSFRLSQEYKRLTPKEQSCLDSIGKQLMAESIPQSDKTCPECHNHFVLINVTGVEIDTCLDCGSFWFDIGELQVLTKKTRDVPGEDMPKEKSSYECPVCKSNMQQHVFQEGSELLVDTCPNDHGVYLERGELKGVLDLPPETESDA